MFITSICDRSVTCDKKQSKIVKECFDEPVEEAGDEILKVLIHEHTDSKGGTVEKTKQISIAAEIKYYLDNPKMLPTGSVLIIEK